jgi:hypothetical protein
MNEKYNVKVGRSEAIHFRKRTRRTAGNLENRAEKGLYRLCWIVASLSQERRNGFANLDPNKMRTGCQGYDPVVIENLGYDENPNWALNLVLSLRCFGNCKT